MVGEDPEPNSRRRLVPASLTGTSSTSAWWLCENGHAWRATVRGRVSAARNASKTTPLPAALASQWHPVLNRGLTPDMVTVTSTKKVLVGVPDRPFLAPGVRPRERFKVPNMSAEASIRIDV